MWFVGKHMTYTNSIAWYCANLCTSEIFWMRFHVESITERELLLSLLFGFFLFIFISSFQPSWKLSKKKTLVCGDNYPKLQYFIAIV